MRRRIGAIAVGCEEHAVRIAQQILERFGQLRVIDRGVQATQDCSDSGVGFPASEVEGF